MSGTSKRLRTLQDLDRYLPLVLGLPASLGDQECFHKVAGTGDSPANSFPFVITASNNWWQAATSSGQWQSTGNE